MRKNRLKLPNYRQARILSILLSGRKYGLQILLEYGRLEEENPLTIGGLYTTLNRLICTGFITAVMGESASKRGGNRRRYFSITADGIRSLDLYDMVILQTEGGPNYVQV